MEQVEVSTTTTILENLESNTVYNVAVVPVYPDVEGIRQTEKGKTSEWIIPDIQLFSIWAQYGFTELAFLEAFAYCSKESRNNQI